MTEHRLLDVALHRPRRRRAAAIGRRPSAAAARQRASGSSHRRHRAAQPALVGCAPAAPARGRARRRPSLQRAAVVLGLRPALRGDALLDVALPLGGEGRALPAVVEVDLLAAAHRRRASLGAVFSMTLHARALARDQDREHRRRAGRRLVVEEHRVELGLARPSGSAGTPPARSRGNACRAARAGCRRAADAVGHRRRTLQMSFSTSVSGDAAERPAARARCRRGRRTGPTGTSPVRSVKFGGRMTGISAASKPPDGSRRRTWSVRSEMFGPSAEPSARPVSSQFTFSTASPRRDARSARWRRSPSARPCRRRARTRRVVAP